MTEFFKRWADGISKVTELQKLKIQIQSTWIMIVGIVAGIVVMAFNFKAWFWGIIILVGAFFNTGVTLIGLYQKGKWLKELEKFGTKPPEASGDTLKEDKEVLYEEKSSNGL